MATGLSPSTRTERVFSCPPFVYDEVYGSDGAPRGHWAKFLTALRSVPAGEFSRRNEQADRMLRENGVSYHSVGKGGSTARPWRLDLLPMLITAADWAVIAEALAQRARLLNLVIADIYGSRSLIDDGTLPPEALYANPEFLRPFCDIGRLGHGRSLRSTCWSWLRARKSHCQFAYDAVSVQADSCRTSCPVLRTSAEFGSTPDAASW